MTFTIAPDAKIEAIAAALVDVFASLPGWTALEYDPGIEGVQQDQVLGLGDMTGTSTGIEEAGHRLGTRDWSERWTVHLYLWLDDPQTAWATGRSAIGQAIAAIDADPLLGGEVREAVVEEWSLAPSEPNSQGRRMLVGELTVAVLTLMPDPPA